MGKKNDVKLDRAFRNLRSTGLLFGGEVTENSGDSTEFDVSAGAAQFVDNSDPYNPMYKIVNFPEFTAQSILASSPATSVFWLDDGTLFTEIFAGVDGPENRRDRVMLSVIRNDTSLNFQFTIRVLSGIVIDSMAALNDLSRAVGQIRFSGLRLEPNGANLSLNRTAGTSYTQFFTNFNLNPKDPSTITLSQATAFQWQPVWINANSTPNLGAFTTTIAPAVYDDGTSIASDTAPQGIVNNNQAQIFRMYEAGTEESFVLEYGQTVYNGIAAAVLALPTEMHTRTFLTDDSAFRGFIVVRGGATDLSLTADALFFDPSSDFVGVKSE